MNNVVLEFFFCYKKDNDKKKITYSTFTYLEWKKFMKPINYNPHLRSIPDCCFSNPHLGRIIAGIRLIKPNAILLITIQYSTIH